MSDDWNNEIDTKLTILTPPSLFAANTGPKIFLAGSIDSGQALDWQSDVAAYIETSWVEVDITVYNPRRTEEFLPEMENETAAWSIAMLNMADYILLHLTGDGASPISTLELGIFINDQRLFLSIDDSYSRKELVEYHYNSFGVQNSYSSPNQCVDAIKSHWYRKEIQ